MLAAWLAEPTETQAVRSELAVKLRGASFADDRGAVLDVVRANLADHATRLEHFRGLREARLPRARRPDRPGTRPVPRRAGIRLEEFWVGWLDGVPRAHGPPDARMSPHVPAPARADHDRRPAAAQPRGDGLDAHRPGGPALRDLPALAAYFAERARGGVGLIVTGGYAPNKRGWLKPFALGDDRRGCRRCGTARSPRPCTTRAARSRCRCCTPAATATTRSASARRDHEVADHAVPAVGAVHVGRGPDGDRDFARTMRAGA